MADFALGELLSPIDFEHLVRDLLSEDLSVELRAFGEGTDGGVDLRYSTSNEKNNIVVQCKRNKHLKKKDLEDEFEKVRTLNPGKYYLATSSSLTPHKVDQIQTLFSKWMKSDKNIYDKTRINQLLDKHKEVLKRHYKLWITSSSLFNEFINKPLINRSKSLFAIIKKQSKFYVKNDSYNEAIEILSKQNFLIISGIPGIGKTTLARIVLQEYVQKGVEVIQIGKVLEGEQVLEDDSDIEQVFYFDDFLGENFLLHDSLEGRSSDLLQFIERINVSSNKKLILTTREYILKQAKEKYEKLNNSNIDIAKHILDLEKYTASIKAHILYNHMYYSGMKTEYITKILENKVYDTIINHRNYSPRIVEAMTIHLDKVNADDYVNEFLEHLENPFIIWSRAFDNQISDGSQALLFVLLSFDGNVVKTELQEAFKSFVKINTKYSNYKIGFRYFDKYLNEIENTFLNINVSEDSTTLIINFQNPSVKDFLINLLKENNDVHLHLVESVIYYNQLNYLIDFSEKYIKTEVNRLALRNVAMRYRDVLDNFYIFPTGQLFLYTANAVSRIKRIAKITDFDESNEFKKFIYQEISNLDIELIQSSSIGAYLELFEQFKEELKSKNTSIINYVSNKINSVIDIKNFYMLFDLFPKESTILILESKPNISDEISNTIEELIENSKSIYDINGVNECLDLMSSNDKFNINVEFDTHLNALKEKTKKIESIKPKKKKEDQMDLIKQKNIDTFDSDKLFTIENFSR